MTRAVQCYLEQHQEEEKTWNRSSNRTARLASEPRAPDEGTELQGPREKRGDQATKNKASQDLAQENEGDSFPELNFSPTFRTSKECSGRATLCAVSLSSSTDTRGPRRSGEEANRSVSLWWALATGSQGAIPAQGEWVCPGTAKQVR